MKTTCKYCNEAHEERLTCPKRDLSWTDDEPTITTDAWEEGLDDLWCGEPYCGKEEGTLHVNEIKSFIRTQIETARKEGYEAGQKTIVEYEKRTGECWFYSKEKADLKKQK